MTQESDHLFLSPRTMILNKLYTDHDFVTLYELQGSGR
jgi:hypothetical protein